MIQHYQDYSQVFNLEIASIHPCSIYSNPSHGVVYYLKQQSLKDLGFPRVKGLRKSFKWKKMNFLTPLPKQQPLVHYLVATGRLGTICYRMHVVACTPELQDDLALGVGILPRQHFRETSHTTPVPRALPTPRPESKTAAALPRKRPKIIDLREEIREKRRLGVHPVDLIALRYLIGPFEREDCNSVLDNGEVELEVKCEDQ